MWTDNPIFNFIAKPKDKLIGWPLIVIAILTGISLFNKFDGDKNFWNDIACHPTPVAANAPDCKSNYNLIKGFILTAMILCICTITPILMEFFFNAGKNGDINDPAKARSKWWNAAHPLFGWSIFGFLLAAEGLWARTYKYLAIKGIVAGATTYTTLTMDNEGNTYWFVSLMLAGLVILLYQTYAANHNSRLGMLNLGAYYLHLLVSICLAVAALASDTFANDSNSKNTAGLYEGFCNPGDNLNCHGVVMGIKIVLIIGTVMTGMNGIFFSFLVSNKPFAQLKGFPIIESIFWSLVLAVGCAWTAFSLWLLIYTRVQFGITGAIWTIDNLWKSNGSFFLLFNALSLTLAWIFYCVHENMFVDEDGNIAAPLPDVLESAASNLASDVGTTVGTVGKITKGALKLAGKAGKYSLIVVDGIIAQFVGESNRYNGKVKSDDSNSGEPVKKWRRKNTPVVDNLSTPPIPTWQVKNDGMFLSMTRAGMSRFVYFLSVLATLGMTGAILGIPDFMQGEDNGVKSNRGFFTSVTCGDQTSSFDCTGYFIGVQVLVPIVGLLTVLAIFKYARGYFQRDHSVFWLHAISFCAAFTTYWLWFMVVKVNDLADGTWSTAGTYYSTGGILLMNLIFSTAFSIFLLILTERSNSKGQVLPGIFYPAGSKGE